MTLRQAFTVLCVLISTVAFAQPPDTVWTRTFGGAGDDIAHVVQQTASGGYILAGSTTSFGLGEQIYFVRTDFQGHEIWTRTYGGPGIDIATSGQQTTDGGFIIAGYTETYGAGGQDVYLIKTNADGDTLWTKTFGGTGNDAANSVQQTPDRGYIIAGRTDSYGNGSQGYLIKTTATGVMTWYHVFGGIGDEAFRCISQASNGGYIITGYQTLFGTDDSQAWLVLTNSMGSPIWDQTYGAVGEEIGHAVVENPFGEFIVAGLTAAYGSTTLNTLLFATNGNGNLIWENNYGGVDDDVGNWLLLDGNHALLTGYTNSWGAGGYDVYLIKFDAWGIILWDMFIGGQGDEVGNYIRSTTDGNFILCGYTTSFGAGGKDAYLIKLMDAGATTPVVLQSFNASITGINVNLCWQTASEIGCYGWKVERSIENADFQVISPIIPGAGNSEEQRDYSFTDASVQSGQTYQYRLQQIDLDGHTSWSDPITIATNALPDQLKLTGVSPNPFNPTTTIHFDLPEVSSVTLTVCDLAGREVRVQTIESPQAGFNQITFDGSTLPSGIYLYKLSAGEWSAGGKMVLLK
jgi:hypothetical protein